MSRNCAYDNTRAICMIWIVCIWHLSGYIDLFPIEFYSESASYITDSCLAAFSFLSGFFLSKYEIVNKTDFVCFYKRRFIRYYPLFFISALSLTVVGYIPCLKIFLLTITGLNTFFPPQAPTLWYISMLTLFYIFTPFILYFKGGGKRIIMSVVLLIVLLLFDCYINEMDERFFYYYPFFVFGIIISTYNPRFQVRKWLAFFSFLMSLSVFYLNLSVKNLVLYPIVLISGVFVLLYIGRCLQKVDKISCFLQYVAYSSMASYFFHRQIYSPLSFFSYDSIIYKRILAFVLFIPLVFLLSYGIQKIYDKIVLKLK